MASCSMNKIMVSPTSPIDTSVSLFLLPFPHRNTLDIGSTNYIYTTIQFSFLKLFQSWRDKEFLMSHVGERRRWAIQNPNKGRKKKAKG